VSKVADRYETQAVRYLYRTVLYEEEHRPLPRDPSPEALFERVDSQLDTVNGMIDDYERGGSDAADLATVAVQLMWLGAAAVTASVHIDPECADLEPTGLKDELLSLIDGNVAEAMKDDGDGDVSPRELCEPCSEYLNEMAGHVWNKGRSDENTLESAAVSLINVANSAAIALALIDRRRTGA
jgi:hypothetical protein